MNFLNTLQPKVIIAVALIVGALMVVSAFIELKQSKGEILHLLTEQSSSLIETVNQSSINALNSSEEIEYLIAERLFNNARLIKKLDSLNLLTQQKLFEIGRENSLFRINIFNQNGMRVLSSRIPEEDHPHGEENINRSEELEPILKDGLKEFVIGLKQAEFTDGQRFAVAIARSNKRGAIVINLDAEEFLEFRKRIGLGKIIRDISDNQGIEYIVLQDSLGILAAGSSVDTISSIVSDPFLVSAINSDKIYSRTHIYKNQEIFESVKRLNYDGEVIGIFRIGLTLDEVRAVEDRMVRRLIIISLVLAAIGVIILSIIFTTQNLKTVSNEFKKFKTFTSTVLENMGEAVIVVDEQMQITLFNKSSKNLFKRRDEDIIQKNLSELSDDISRSLLEYCKNSGEQCADVAIDTAIGDERKYLLLNFTRNKDEDGKENFIIVINDLTESRRLEEESKRKEKLSAMGELASGVAHEIRNPINAIGMIAQRLDKEFKVEKDSEEYHSITSLLRSEVTRINKIITQFLSYAKPLSLQIKKINAKAFFDDIYRLFSDQAKIKGVELIVLSDQSFDMKIDPELIKQSMMNLVQNAIDAVEKKGKVEINYFRKGNDLNIEIADNGKGIPENVRNKIFDLYYTSKPEGTGLGLSIVQKIIAEHNGTIEVFSEINTYTKFKITIPQT
ncbi:MAG: PAS domain-containing protein [Ignavibacteriaceae bacterium]|nr:PAS domain-containing protein [Ignavibacteriaceae bacterium]